MDFVNKLEKIEVEFNTKDIRKFYKYIKFERKEYHKTQIFLEDDDGNLLKDTENVRNR